MSAEPDMFHRAGEVTQVSIIERWAWYHRALKDPALINGKTLLVHPSEYELGYYRMRANKTGAWVPVGIYPDEQGRDGAQVGPHEWTTARDLPDLFKWCCRFPISHDAFMQAIAGGGFDDEPPAPLGHNSGETDPVKALLIEFIGEQEQADECLKKPITTQADADRAAIWSRRLADIAKRATEMHGGEKRPILDEGKRIDDRWRKLKDEPAALSTKLKRHTDAWLKEQARLEEERVREAVKEANRIRREAEQAAREAEVSATTISDEDAEKRKAEAARLAERSAAADREAQARNVSAGRTGARTSLRTFKVAKITDYDALVAALKDRPEVKEVITTLANRAAKADYPLPGMEIVEEKRAV